MALLFVIILFNFNLRFNYVSLFELVNLWKDLKGRNIFYFLINYLFFKKKIREQIILIKK